MMIMVRAIVRPEKAADVLAALMDAGFPAVTKYSVAGRGKQRGIKIGEITYTIMKAARSGKQGAFGDGKIFISEVQDIYTISSGTRETAAAPKEAAA
jgi:nitrogen regulatory protein PII 1